MKIGVSFCLLFFVLIGIILNLQGLFEITRRTSIPDNFDIEKNVFYKATLACEIAIYKVRKFDKAFRYLEPKGYEPFLIGQGLNKLLEQGVGRGLMIGSTASAGKYCLENSSYRREYLGTLYSEQSYFSYNNLGALLAYNPQTNILYFVAGN